MAVDEAVLDALEPRIGVLAPEVAVAGVEVDGDGGRVHQGVDLVEAVGALRVLLVRLEPDDDAPRLGDRCRLVEHVAHQLVVLLLRRPARLRPLIRVDDPRAALDGEADGLLEVLDADLGLAQRGVGREARHPDAGLVADPAHPQRVVEHGDAVEVACLAEQLAAPVDHGLDVLVAQLGGFLVPPLEGLVLVPHVLHVHAQADLCHVVLLPVLFALPWPAHRLCASASPPSGWRWR